MDVLDRPEDQWRRRMPTCVAAFDTIVKGGLPVGSLVLLLGEIGAGHTEFAHTSAAKLALAKTKPRYRPQLITGFYGQPVIPEKICYISFTKSERDVLREVSISFNEEYYTAFKENLIFKDFSRQYFKQTIVPASWSAQASSLFQMEDNGSNLLEELINFLDQNGRGNLVIIDSLTDLMMSSNVDQVKFVSILKGMQRVCKDWNGLVYMLLTKNIAPAATEQTISDIADGLLVFEWWKSATHSQRHRSMHVGKFTGVLPHLEDQRIARFMTEVSGRWGFVVAYTDKIM